MKRRSFLSATVGAASAIAGCLSSGQSSTAENYHDIIDPDPTTTEAGLTPKPKDVPERDVSPDNFETYTATNDANTALRMVPLDVARYWYHTQKARFIDARTKSQYKHAHIAGAEFSPAPRGGSKDPVGNWNKNVRIVAYCTCPHHLSGIRAGNLIENGFTGAYVLGPGMEPWARNNYPMAGTQQSKTTFVDDYSNVKKKEKDGKGTQ